MKSDPRRVALDLIETIIRRSGHRPSALATAAGIAPSTVMRFLKGEDKNVPGLRTIVALADEVGAEISLGDAPESLPFSPQTLRLALQVALHVLSKEPYTADALTEITVEVYGWLDHQAAEGHPMASLKEVLSYLGPLVKSLGHSDPSESGTPTR